MRRPMQQRRPVRPVILPRRRVEVGPHDTIVFGDLEIDADILAMVLDTKVRGLWSFVLSDDGRVQPALYTEDRVLWLEDSDIKRGVD